MPCIPTQLDCWSPFTCASSPGNLWEQLLCLSFVTFLTEACRDDNNKASHGAKPISVKASHCSVNTKKPHFFTFAGIWTTDPQRWLRVLCYRARQLILEPSKKNSVFILAGWPLSLPPALHSYFWTLPAICARWKWQKQIHSFCKISILIHSSFFFFFNSFFLFFSPMRFSILSPRP